MIEPHYTTADLCKLLRQHPDTMRRAIRAGKFGADVLRDGKEYLVPVSGVEAWRRARLVVPRAFSAQPAMPMVEPIVARTPGELLRKARAKEELPA